LVKKTDIGRASVASEVSACEPAEGTDTIVEGNLNEESVRQLGHLYGFGYVDNRLVISTIVHSSLDETNGFVGALILVAKDIATTKEPQHNIGCVWIRT
jgi:hypothetical protein